MIAVEEALAGILAPLRPLGGEEVSLAAALGRVLARDVPALRTHPPTDVSAMDGYAVRAEDAACTPAELSVIGAAPAGKAFTGRVGKGEAVRIFTGGAVPAGADAIVIQEDVESLEKKRIRVHAAAKPGRHIRAKGLDVAASGIVLGAGRILTARDIGLAATAGHDRLCVIRQPRVALIFTGSELKRPGEALGPDDIVNSNAPMLAAFVSQHGGVPLDLGIAVDDAAALAAAAEKFDEADICVTVGGASVGDHDLVQPVLTKAGLEVGFWKVAMRPGKPLIHGNFRGRPFLGLPGNPVSAMVCAILFLRPMVEALGGRPIWRHAATPARLAAAMPANGTRQDYVRASLERREDGSLWACPMPVQDSAMLSILAKADGLIVRPIGAPAAPSGASVPVIRL
ncbi:MAG: gephyrin-like molybdotransferase Glp [Pseudomonadota bacterium]